MTGSHRLSRREAFPLVLHLEPEVPLARIGGSPGGVGGARYPRPFCCFLPPAVWETQGSAPTCSQSHPQPPSPLLCTNRDAFF